ncbi:MULTISPECIES: MalY/PatB family protein [unclassified Bacillus (in: firmicutes)]|uniref:MalY/PatB family protein n=1 Tax=unclassified Bacillus (in: firmicutes) TaxID=185979 RepID=UPI0008E4212A|nr:MULTISPECIES: PatB family C-S lyase [unclassified Bacillus (in: firmicutes)]SFB13062.1 cystathione beta-lyase [Bacillus sp. UNCCL13]SFQ90121.1 cystathione beta-lyase [Bacillus sp. cl95]
MSIFDRRIDRNDTGSVKWGLTKDIFGGEGLLPMWVADMDFEPPREVIDAILKRAEHPVYGYTFVPETTATAISNWLKKRHDWQVQSNWILYANGVVAALSTAIQSFSNPGDRIMIHTPVYTPFFEMINKNDRIAIHSPLLLKGNLYEIDFNNMEKELQSGVRLLILCNPHNPVGRVWTKNELIKIGELCEKYDCLILSDEIHSDLIVKGTHVPIASLSITLSNRVITFVSPSKTFNLAGLQASAVIIENENLRQKYKEMSERQGFFTLNTFGIIAMENAYRYGEPWLEQLLEYLSGNISFTEQYLLKHLPEITFSTPEGTYLLWLDCRKLHLDETELVKRLIKKGKVALEPGSKYGKEGIGFMRMNIACPRSLLSEGLERLRIAFE